MVTEYKPGAATMLVPFQNEVRDIDLERQSKSTGSSGGEAALSVSGSAMLEGCRTRSSPAAKGRLQYDPMPPQTDDDAMRKRVLLCTPGRRFQEFKAACVTGARTDQCMFKALHDSLYSAKRKMMYWATLRRLNGINFAEVRKAVVQ